ncbi:Diflavin flavoprotein A 1 [Poriferisphaera corsica]|uniref:Diflavin flavoprotein A 1 n=1 Tax=Poriferisphaera corsica TaxID=2528020 RepID=A0A517YRY9_9BACT|nr:flavin reductase family protein [Poriferisphaera corsica]QDU32981.1 Diflavin flavoprotein A 1 [Poriferisphaera corsica]
MPSSKSVRNADNPESQTSDLAQILGQIPSGIYVLTAHHEDRRLGMLASWIQQVSFNPPMISIAIAKGRPIMPLISESRHFALCQLADHHTTIKRKFAAPSDFADDPFLGYQIIHGKSPSLPILADSLNYLECEVSCHMDVDGDHDIFIAKILNAKTLNPGPPAIHLRDSGFHY